MIVEFDALSVGLTPDQLRSARQTFSDQRDWSQVAHVLRLDSPNQAMHAVAAAMNLEVADLSRAEPDPEVLGAFPPRLIHRHEVFPLHRDDQGTLKVATPDPFDLHALDAASSAAGCKVSAVIADPIEVAKLIKQHLGLGAETIDGLLAKQKDDDSDIEVLDELQFDGTDDAELAQQASVVRLVNEILSEAVEARASDIHIEAQEAGLKLRYRIDGVLQRQPTPPEMNRFQAAIISRLKIMAKLNIAEKRVPQDGRIKLRVSGREIDVRVSIIPMLHGEGVVMRVLDKDAMSFSLRGVGMGENLLRRFSKLIRLPHGIVLVTGPTGSGKTTTLYSALSEIRDEETKIITTEDPIEYQLEGINQIQVHSKVGLTFAASLRSILRHDPDVVLVGEIRDHETAENATQASLTGHLVFSTLHTNDASSAFTRLCDMGVEPFLVASTIEGVLAQRLVRRLCSSCCEAYTPRRDELPEDFPWDAAPSQPQLWRPVGCRECRNTGYRGRQGVFELLTASPAIRELVGRRASSIEIKQAALRGGMESLRDDAWAKTLAGVTTVSEVLRVTHAD